MANNTQTAKKLEVEEPTYGKRNSITHQHIKAMLDAAAVEEHIFHGNKELNVSYKLSNGFTITGRSAVIDPVNFDISVGRRNARHHAEEQLWLLEGYRLQCDLHRERVLLAPMSSIEEDMDMDEPLPARTCNIDGEPCESCT